jgi:hypothetical protein
MRVVGWNCQGRRQCHWVRLGATRCHSREEREPGEPGEPWEPRPRAATGGPLCPRVHEARVRGRGRPRSPWTWRGRECQCGRGAFALTFRPDGPQVEVCPITRVIRHQRRHECVKSLHFGGFEIARQHEVRHLPFTYGKWIVQHIGAREVHHHHHRSHRSREGERDAHRETSSSTSTGGSQKWIRTKAPRSAPTSTQNSRSRSVTAGDTRGSRARSGRARRGRARGSPSRSPITSRPFPHRGRLLSWPSSRRERRAPTKTTHRRPTSCP